MHIPVVGVQQIQKAEVGDLALDEVLCCNQQRQIVDSQVFVSVRKHDSTVQTAVPHRRALLCHRHKTPLPEADVELVETRRKVGHEEQQHAQNVPFASRTHPSRKGYEKRGGTRPTAPPPADRTRGSARSPSRPSSTSESTADVREETTSRLRTERRPRLKGNSPQFAFAKILD